MDFLLLFPGRGGGLGGWLTLTGGVVGARGGEEEPVPIPAPGRAAIVVPGDRVALHWLDIPSGLTQPQAAAAARLMAAELTAQPLEELHVAVGREEKAGAQRCVGLVPAAFMAEWLGEARARGLDPEHVVPETLLLPAEAGALVRFDRGNLSLYRGETEAFALEPELAPLVVGGRAVRELEPEALEAGLAGALSPPLLDLRQGPFARRRRLKLERARLRRMALAVLALISVTLVLQLAAILRYTFAADEAEAEAKRIAASALPRGGPVGDASAALSRRLGELRGGGAGYGATAGAVFEAVRSTPDVELAALAFGQDGTLRATVQGDPAAVSALTRRVEQAGFAADAAPPRSGGGRQMTDVTVRPR